MKLDTSPTKFSYLSGFANHFATEALAGVLPQGMNSPQRLPHGLYAEQLSGTAFTSVRSENRRSWLYRRSPSVNASTYDEWTGTAWRTAPLSDGLVIPHQLRWATPETPSRPQNFIEGIFTVGANGSALEHAGVAVHIYQANRSMDGMAFSNADGELLVIPQSGALRVQTEAGWFDLAPVEVLVIPRGMQFRVELVDDTASGYIMENYGAMLRLPELGPIGANGLANQRDFLAPVAAFDKVDVPFELITKLGGRFWQRRQAHSPFDVVAWHGNLAPYKYDLRTFNTFGSVSFDSPDPSISTVLTSPSHLHGTADCDFVVFPPRWQVAENTFRPPFFHRNVMTEFMGLITGTYEGKGNAFMPGGFSLHTQMTPHGPDTSSFHRGADEAQVPSKLDATFAFMIETRLPLSLNPAALQWPTLDKRYVEAWSGLARAALP
ncbi:homogentisate 1,2-dioxygenase [Ottowia thiooxydans]|uniref:homogentisate 1,2-dioxygenase n=1 Tax=Ottowia thiooxydans TaxID=219182 RepID=UPI003F50B47B